MNHPLLTKVLADANSQGPAPAIADRLEAALDVCQWHEEGYTPCGEPEDVAEHEYGTVTCEGLDPDGTRHQPDILCHPFVPLVTPMNHPLLTKVLADALNSPGVFEDPLDDDVGLTDVITAIDPAIADRLEAALDVCQWHEDSGWGACGQDRGAPEHDTFTRDTAGPHPPNYGCHPFVPLVTL